MYPRSRKSAIRVGSGTRAKRCASKKHPRRPGGFGEWGGGRGLKSRKRVFCIKILNPIKILTPIKILNTIYPSTIILPFVPEKGHKGRWIGRRPSRLTLLKSNLGHGHVGHDGHGGRGVQTASGAKEPLRSGVIWNSFSP